ncbi:GLUG motif-containing protein [Methanolapillus millepedarum]|uniref:GLUG domain-containing protein n=1 Tax=Methanolapillus millepedarum TaxID=3028296 RepID=A0AA96ZUL7_9EURY|nr:hypothetical protein MsAc7_13190 [Methanosarcinaceae archaeon Ac7]
MISQRRPLHFLFICSLIFVLFSFFIGPAAAAFSGAGNGTPSDPYQITTIAQLDEVRHNLSASYILMNDLDFSGSNLSWEPIGEADVDSKSGQLSGLFSGQFDGNGKTIRNLSVSYPERSGAGLFGHVGQRGEITNLTLDNVTISAQSSAGSLAGQNDGIIRNCSAVHVAAEAFNDLGGLVGVNNGFISNCFATGHLSGGNMIGGLVGINCGVVNESYASFSICGTGYDAGGLVGYNFKGRIWDCYSFGSVSSNSIVGGLAGGNYEGIIDRCYAVGTVYATRDYAGGLVGLNQGYLKDSYALTESVDVGTDYSSEYAQQKSIGKIAGVNDDYCTGFIFWCYYWDEMTTNEKFRKDGDNEVTLSVSSKDVWGTAGQHFYWNAFGVPWELKDFADYPLPVFEWQEEPPGDVSYLNPDNSMEKPKKLPGFELAAGIFVGIGVVLFIYRKR